MTMKDHTDEDMPAAVLVIESGFRVDYQGSIPVQNYELEVVI